jgi:hypothetical protein
MKLSEGSREFSMEPRSVSSPQWKQLYQAAILETDAELLSQRIVSAEGAISTRISELDSNPDVNFGERTALTNALLMLKVLRRLADEGKAA